MISLRYDPDVDVLDITVSHEAISQTAQIDEGTLVDMDRLGRVVSIEVIRPARPWPLDAILASYDLSDEDTAQLRRLLPGQGDVRPFAEGHLTLA